MQQLDAQHVKFIYQETATTPMHLAGFGIFDQSTVPGGRLGHKNIISFFEDRLHIVPCMRQRLVHVPLGMDQPYWINDPKFDIEFHIRHIALPQPGDWRQLCILISRINSRSLDMKRPPWEVYIIEGLDDVEGAPPDSFVIYIKIHQACTDGWNGHAMLAALLDASPDTVIPPARESWAAEREPSNLELLLRSMPNRIVGPFQQMSSFTRKLPRMSKGLRDMLDDKVDSGSHLRVPDTRFNATPTSHRVFEATSVPLESLRKIKNAIDGATINDVVMTIVGGAMRRYLEQHGETPESSLGVTVPVQITDETARQGPRMVDMLVDMHTDLEEPLERLQSVHRSAVNAKKLAAKFDVSEFVKGEFSALLNPAMTKSLNRWMGRLHMGDKMTALGANTMIVNQIGPATPLYHSGARMLNYYAIPPLTNTLGLAHMVLSYAGEMTITAYACRKMMPDPDFYISCIRNEFENCLKAASAVKASRKVTLQTKARTTRSRAQSRTRSGGVNSKQADTML